MKRKPRSAICNAYTHEAFASRAYRDSTHQQEKAENAKEIAKENPGADLDRQSPQEVIQMARNTGNLHPSLVIRERPGKTDVARMGNSQ